MTEFVVYREEGSYSDYSMHIVCIARTEDTAKRKVAALEADNNRVEKAFAEFREYQAHWMLDNPRPPYAPYARGTNTEYDACQKAQNAWNEQWLQLSGVKTKELIAKYEIASMVGEDALYLYYTDESSFNYQEVEVIDG